MNRKINSVVRYCVGIVLAAIFLYLAFRGVDLEGLKQALVHAHYKWIISTIPVILLGHVLRAWRWQYLLAPIKPKISLRNLFSALMVGYMINNISPRLGEVVRPYLLGKREQISKSAAFGTVVVERILDLITSLFFLLVILALYADSLQEIFPSLIKVKFLLFFGALVLAAVAFILLFKSEPVFRLLIYSEKILPTFIAKRIEELVNSFLRGFLVVKERRHYFIITLTSFLIWGSYIALLHIYFFAFDPMDKPAFNFGSATILITVSSLAFILPAPGAMGTYHSFMTFTLVRLFRINPATALSYSIVSHGLGYLVTTIVGLFYFFLDHVRVSEALEAKVGENLSMGYSPQKNNQ